MNPVLLRSTTAARCLHYAGNSSILLSALSVPKDLTAGANWNPTDCFHVVNSDESVATLQTLIIDPYNSGRFGRFPVVTQQTDRDEGHPGKRWLLWL